MGHKFMYAAIIILAMLLSSCIHPISKDVRSTVAPQLAMAEVSADPSAYIDQRIIAGGVIITHEGDAEGSLLEVMDWQVNRWGEPTYLDDEERRFLVRAKEALDPVGFEPGTMVTLAGSVTGVETRLRDGQEYRYPVLELLEIYLWQSPFRYGVHQQDPATPVYVGDESDRYDRHPYDPGYSGYPYTPYSYRGRYD